MPDISSILSLPYIQPSQAQKHVTHNQAVQSLDVLVQLAVADRDRIAPPATPTAGDRHIVAAGATAAWSGSDGKIAVWENGQWLFFDPLPGWRAEIVAEALAVVFDGAAWSDRVVDFDNLVGVGINTTSDSTNRLAVSAAATLLGHEGNGHQLKVNKAADTDTASLLFQSDYVGHAEMGLMGGAGFSIKTSLDGIAWAESLRIGAAGIPVLPLGATINGPVDGTAVQADMLDATIGRLMITGAFGLGNTGTAPEIPDMDGATTPTGCYGYSAATPNVASRPGAAASVGTIVVTRALSGTCAQMLIEDVATAMGGDSWYRTYSATFGAWSGWRLIYTPENVLGTVSQSVGVPTGAVIERGSNANGEYVRFADGTQICRFRLNAVAMTNAHVPSGLYYATAFAWAFPAAFVNDTGATGPFVTGRINYWSGLGVNVANFGMTTQAATCYAWAATSNTSDVQMFAAGRWI